MELKEHIKPIMPIINNRDILVPCMIHPHQDTRGDGEGRGGKWRGKRGREKGARGEGGKGRERKTGVGGGDANKEDMWC